MTTGTALIAGATGLIGRQLLEQILVSPNWASVRVLSRRSIAHENPKLEVCEINFDRLPNLAQEDPALFDVDAVFCCLGTTLKTAGSKAAFAKVDRDYVVNLAKAAEQGGARRFLMVSAIGADAGSMFFYNRIKGETEAAVKALRFEAVHIFQPSLLLGDRQEHRPGEAFSQKLSPALSPLLAGPLARYRPVAGATVAAAMLDHAASDSTGIQVHRYDGSRFR